MCDNSEYPGDRRLDTGRIKSVVLDFGGTLSSDQYFKLLGPQALKYVDLIMSGKDNPHIVQGWLKGVLTSKDVAAYLSKRVHLRPDEIHSALRAGCKQIVLNPAVWDLAQRQHALGRKTALVTANFDVFTDVIVPARGLHSVFDAIVNSSDYGSPDKEVLWPIAFEMLGAGYGYSASLLIEDTAHEVRRFRARGGAAYQYTGDASFIRWLTTAPGLLHKHERRGPEDIGTY